MKQNEIPQDPSVLDKFTKEVCYAVNDRGEYVTALSRGWQVKADALGITWHEIEERLQLAAQHIRHGQASPLAYYMELHLMDVSIVAAYTGFWRWQVKRHLRAAVFQQLSDKKLKRYADLFNVTVTDLRNFTPPPIHPPA